MASKSLKEVLEELEQKDDTNWTAEGLPTIDAVSKKAGRNVTRKEINEASPGFVRKTDAQGAAFTPKTGPPKSAAVHVHPGTVEIDGVSVVSQVQSPAAVAGGTETSRMRGNAIDAATGNPIIVDNLSSMDRPTATHVLGRDAEPGSTDKLIAHYDAEMASAQKAVDEANARLAEVTRNRDNAIMANEMNLSSKPKHVQQMESTMAFIEAGKRDRGVTSGKLAPVDEAMARVGSRPVR